MDMILLSISESIKCIVMFSKGGRISIQILKRTKQTDNNLYGADYFRWIFAKSA